MTELEQQVVELEEEVRKGAGGDKGAGGASLPHGSLQNKKLLRENQLLRERTCDLARENQELRCRLGFDALKTEVEEEEGEEFQVSRPRLGQS